MIFLPIVERELRVLARKASIYRIRALSAVLTSCVAFFLMLAGFISGSARIGGHVFSTLVTLAFVYCLFEGLRGADTLSEEKRDGTLGLLFLTDLRGYDVVLGKLIAIAVRSFHGLFAFLPVLSIALILGGVTAGEFWRSTLVLLNTLFFSVSVALCVSAFSREAHRALGGTILLLGLITIGLRFLPRSATPLFLQPIVGWIAVLSPITALRDAQDVLYTTASSRYWSSLGATHCLAWLALFVAGRATRVSWREGESKHTLLRNWQRWWKWRVGQAEVRAAIRKERLDLNPFFWLGTRYQRDSILSAAIFGSISLFGFIGWLVNARSVLWAFSLVGSVALLSWVGWRAVQTFAEARQSGALELLLVTPTRVEAMIHGQWLALKHLFVLPVAFVLLLRLMGHFTPEGPTGASWHFALLRWASAGFDALSFVISLLAFIWVGMWMGISRRKPLEAFLCTMVLGFIVPGALVCIPNLAIHLGLLGWARTRLLRESRLMASRGLSASKRDFLRPHLAPVSTVPPVILAR